MKSLRVPGLAAMKEIRLFQDRLEVRSTLSLASLTVKVHVFFFEIGESDAFT